MLQEKKINIVKKKKENSTLNRLMFQATKGQHCKKKRQNQKNRRSTYILEHTMKTNIGTSNESININKYCKVKFKAKCKNKARH
jgi:hypothetical protein